MKTITKTIRIDEDIYETLKQNSDAIQQQEDFSTLGEIYNMFLRLGIMVYLERGNQLDLTPFLPDYMQNTTETTEETEETEENNQTQPEQRLSEDDFLSLLKEGLYSDLEILTTFHQFANVRVLSLFNNKVEEITNGFEPDMIEVDKQIELSNFISFFIRSFAYLNYIYYPGQLDLVDYNILLQQTKQHPFLYIVNSTHYIEKDDIQIMLIKDLFKRYKELELDIRLEIQEERGV